MKKRIGIFLLIVSFFTVDATIGYVKKEKQEPTIFEEPKEIRAVYISYLEYFNHFYGGSKTINQAKIDKMIDNIVSSKFNTILLHVSPFSDSIYASKLFPYSYTLTGKEDKDPGFDYLDYFIKKSHAKKIKLYAWINPYRISFDNNTKNISEKNPAYQLLNTTNVKISQNGIYYNPASEIVKSLILRQVEEIINKYPVDGIHFDDYFYMQKDIDKLEYENYQKNGGEMSLKEFRLFHTNDLIKRVYKTIKDKNKDIIFSIAPDGNINNNYTYHYADVKTWLKSNEYIDMIMPQIYYGFENEYAPFTKSLDNWIKLVTNKEILIVPVLAIYKSGIEDLEAGSGKKEWISNSDIVIRQVKLIRLLELDGYSLFRYDFMYNKAIMSGQGVNEMLNLEKIN